MLKNKKRPNRRRYIWTFNRWGYVWNIWLFVRGNVEKDEVFKKIKG